MSQDGARLRCRTFIRACRDSEDSFSAICESFTISRKTVYKWRARDLLVPRPWTTDAAPNARNPRRFRREGWDTTIAPGTFRHSSSAATEWIAGTGCALSRFSV